MHARYEAMYKALDELADEVWKIGKAPQSLLELNGWAWPATDSSDFSFMVRKVQKLVADRAPDDYLGEDESPMDVDLFVARVNSVKSQTIHYLFNGNGQQAAPAFSVSMQALEAWIEHYWPEREILDASSFPAKIARQARTSKIRLDEAVKGLDGIEKSLAIISDAHSAAESLPTDLEELRQARKTLTSINGQSATDAAAIKEIRLEVESLLASVRQADKDANALVANCEEAYQITTTKGLAAAFDQRAASLSSSMWVCVGGLVVALICVSLIGHNRIGALTEVLAGDPKWGTVTLNFLLSAISVGAPLWFAWVATKQIGQRFRLAEDYGFKASVAKAYEGYRKQAVQIDPKFEAQLFSIALSRLEEAPLRLVETESHGSPWHEVLGRKNGHQDAKPTSPSPATDNGVAQNPKNEG